MGNRFKLTTLEQFCLWSNEMEKIFSFPFIRSFAMNESTATSLLCKQLLNGEINHVFFCKKITCEMIKTISKYPAASLEGFLSPKCMPLTPNKPAVQQTMA